jgi:ribose transport system ATP-binding protein
MSDRSAALVAPDVLLKAHGIGKSFPGVRALDKVDILVRRGSLNALVGENGAGKSTLMNILAGVFPPDQGQILLNGKPVSFRNPREAQDVGVAIIHQELPLVPNLSVAENIFLGREPRTRLGLIDYRKMLSDARILLAPLDPDLDPRSLVSRFRVGAQQIVEIAKALSFNAQVIIMDEPTSAITEHEVTSLFRLIEQLKQQGVGIIYITHKLAELPRIADEITVLRDGRLIANKDFRDVTHDEIVRMMVGRDLVKLLPKAARAASENALEVRGISLKHSDRPGDFAVRDVSFDVRSGEVVGIFGLMGAGRTELLQTIFGLHPRNSSGTVAVAGKRVDIRSPGDAIAAGLALAPEDRKAEGLILIMSVAQNCSLASLKRTTQFGMLRPMHERSLVAKLLNRLTVKTPSIHEPVRNLSGGNQQKVVLSKWLATEPKVLLLDEPTRGIDLNAKREIYALLDELAGNSLGIVVVSSELPEILSIADRILVLAEGRLTAEFDRGEATEEKILKAALPKGAAQAEIV